MVSRIAGDHRRVGPCSSHAISKKSSAVAKTVKKASSSSSSSGSSASSSLGGAPSSSSNGLGGKAPSINNNKNNNNNKTTTKTTSMTSSCKSVRCAPAAAAATTMPSQVTIVKHNDISNTIIGNTIISINEEAASTTSNNVSQHQSHNGIPSIASIASSSSSTASSSPSSSSRDQVLSFPLNYNLDHDNSNGYNNSNNHLNEDDDEDDNEDYNEGYNDSPPTATSNPTTTTIPSYLLCPITNTLMTDPVIDPHGHTFERDAILRWVVLHSSTADGRMRSPMNMTTTPNSSTMIDDDDDDDIMGAMEGYVSELMEDRVVKGAIERRKKNYCNDNIDKHGSTTSHDHDHDDDGDGDTRNLNNEKKKKNAKTKKDKQSKFKETKESLLWKEESLRWNNNNNNNDNKESESATATTTTTTTTTSFASIPPPPPKRSAAAPSGTTSGTSTHTPPPLKCKNNGKNNNNRPRRRNLSDISNQSTAASSDVVTAAAPADGVVPSNNPSAPLKSRPPSQQLLRLSQSNKRPQPTIAPAPIVPSIIIPKKGNSNNHNNNNFSVCSAISASSASLLPMPQQQHTNGWMAQLGVYKIISSSGLIVTADVHRRSTPIKTFPQGSFVNVVETQTHGGRVRGNIVWEEEVAVEQQQQQKQEEASVGGGGKGRKSRFLNRGRKLFKNQNKDDALAVAASSSLSMASSTPTLVTHTGWISLQWAEEYNEEEKNESASTAKDSTTTTTNSTRTTTNTVATGDETQGPWTQPIPLGVYRINFGTGLPLRETSERDSPVIEKLERGRVVEVVQTEVKNHRVRARCIVPVDNRSSSSSNVTTSSSTNGKSFQSGWISLLNFSGSSAASPVPLGAYVAVAETGCTITEGGCLDSKVKEIISPGSCIEICSTRIEEGVVRGLLTSGGYISLFSRRGERVGTTAGTATTGKMFAMPVPLGTYQTLVDGLAVTTGFSSTSSMSSIKLKKEACVEIVETRVEDGRVRGRMSSIISGGVASEACGWIDLFEPRCRWAKIVCFKGGRAVVSQGGMRK